LFYKIGKEFFKLLINIFQFLRVFLIFLAFATVLYWFLQLAGVTFVQIFAPFFESIKAFVHLFYMRTVSVDTVTIDFSFLLASLIMIAISWGLKFVVESLEFAETKYDSICSVLKDKAEVLFNMNLEHNYLAQEHKNTSFLVIVQISALNLAKDSHFNKDVNLGVEGMQKTVLKELYQSLSGKKGIKQKFVEDKLLISYEPFEDFDKVIIEIATNINALKNKYKEDKWRIFSTIGVETFAAETEIESKIINLKKLLRLGLKNEIACLSTFKQRYSLLKNAKFKIEGKGLYTINDREETVYCVE